MFKTWITTRPGKTPRVVSIRLPQPPYKKPQPGRDYADRPESANVRLFFDAVLLALCGAAGFMLGWTGAYFYFS